jgi:hypothetical protein
MLLRPEYLSQKLDRPLPTKDGGTLRTIGYSELSANPLMGNWSNFEEFSERAFKDKRNYGDFDSAMRRFESSRPTSV